MEINWRSEQGKRTRDNPDCAGVGVRADAVLCLLLDGSTSGPTSGDLARQIIRDIVDWYVANDEAATVECLSAQLRRTHRSLSWRFPRDSASYVLVHMPNTGTALVLHAGDCLLGSREENGAVHWFTKPHTLANPIGDVPFDEIARSPALNRLTRSFRAREFIPGEVNKITAESGKSFVAATDGFWAELSAGEQAMFLQGDDVAIAAEGDDRSALQIGCLNEPGTKIQFVKDAATNLYIKRS
ncbi:protein phosphatase 2C domain-containing protein [Bradyrhizobium sp. SBR1B]|uniref:protein phosphatase 2C domain-containing protein n=1 Tax=Bradyrhizobium sp. SBR1B TaxID=2663836 RepID=UPI0016064A1D|nr:protein phosphatase 2C domain-containing protein [Bradyrhizobium sp. SBR1B]MBB4382700.1 serine/threonine protein phosphatase PrpC [Bradyrhizobium sp. SBR1B]